MNLLDIGEPSPLGKPTREPFSLDSSHIEAELSPAIAAAQRLSTFHESLGVAPDLVTLAGAAFVEFIAPNFYQPDAAGTAAVIVGAVEGYWPGEFGCAEVVDLVAIEIDGERVANRYGIAAVLGSDAIELARWYGSVVKVVTPHQWLAGPDRSVAVVDWRRAAFALQDAPELHFTDAALAFRVRNCFARPLGRPRILIPE